MAEFDGDPDGLDGFSVPVLASHCHFPFLEQFAVHGLGEGFYRAPAGVEVFKPMGPVGKGVGFDEVSDGLDDLVAFFVVKLEGLEVFQAGGTAEGGPEFGLQGAQGDEFMVGGFVGVVEGVAVGEEGVASGGCLAGLLLEVEGQVHEGQGAVGDGDVDVLALARTLPVEKGQKDSGDGAEAAPCDIGNLKARGAWSFLGADEVQGTCHAEVVDVVSRGVAVGAGLAVSGDGAVDDAGVDGFDMVVAHAQAVGDAGAEALHDDVGPGCQLQEDFFTRVGLQVEAHVLFVAIDEVWEGPLGGVARILKGNDPGAVIGEHHGAPGAGKKPGQVEDGDAGQCSGGHGLSF